MFGLVLSSVVLPMKSKAHWEPVNSGDNIHVSKDEHVVEPNQEFINFYNTRDKCMKVMMVASMVTTPVIFAVCYTWLYAVQDNFYGFMYLSCVPYTSTFCLDYGVILESRNFY